MSTSENWDFHVYWEEKMSQIWNIWFLVPTSTSKSRLYCVYKGCLIGNCNRGPTLEVKYIFSSKENWTNRSALALIKWSMKSSLKKKCNCTQLRGKRGEIQILLVAVNKSLRTCLLACLKQCSGSGIFVCSESHKRNVEICVKGIWLLYAGRQPTDPVVRQTPLNWRCWMLV